MRRPTTAWSFGTVSRPAPILFLRLADLVWLMMTADEMT
jgi:hypothetical protein